MLPRSRFALACVALLAGAAVFGGVSASADTVPANHWQIQTIDSGTSQLIGEHGLPSATDQTMIYGDSVQRSTDGGTTWTHHVNPCSVWFGQMVNDPAPTRPDTLYAACNSQGLYRSTDAGITWNQVSLADPNHNGDPAEIVAVGASSTAPYTVYAMGADAYPYSGASTLFSSTDGGDTWTPHAMGGLAYSSELTLAMAVSASDPLSVAVAGQATPGGAFTVRVTHDGGATWTSHAGGSGMGMQFDASDPSKLYAISGSGVSESDDDGAAWTLLPGSPQGFQISSAPGALYVTATGAIWKSADGGVTWKSAENTVLSQDDQQAEFEGLAVNPSDADRFYAYDANHASVWTAEFDSSLPATETYQEAELNAPSDISPTSATLSATFAPDAASASGLMEWYWTGTTRPTPTSEFDEVIPALDPTADPAALVTPTLTHTITGLKPNTTYAVALDGSIRFPGNSVSLSNTPHITFTTPPAVPPSITRSPQAVLAAGQVRSGSVPVTVSWATSKGTYAVGRSTLGRRLGHGSWVLLGETWRSTFTSRVALGKAAKFRVQASDGPGTLSPLTVGPKASVLFKDDAGSAASWAGGWKKAKSATAVDKTLRTSTSGAASVTLQFTGRSIAVIAPKGTHYAHYTATLDGKAKGTVATSAGALTARRTIAIYSFASAGKHTLVLHVVRSSGHTLAALDGFVVLG